MSILTTFIATPLICSLGATAFNGVLDRRDTSVTKDLGVTREDRALIERLRLKNGIEIEYSVGGCEHLNAKYAYKSVPTPKDLEARTILELITQLLNDTKVVEGAFDLRRTLADAANNILREKKIQTTGNMIVQSCGEATCTYSWKSSSKGKIIVEAQYSFAL